MVRKNNLDDFKNLRTTLLLEGLKPFVSKEPESELGLEETIDQVGILEDSTKLQTPLKREKINMPSSNSKNVSESYQMPNGSKSY